MVVDISSDAYIQEANAGLKNKPCPLCLHFGSGSVEFRLEAKPVGTFSLAGVQDKVSAVGYLHYTCSACKQEGRLRQ